MSSASAPGKLLFFGEYAVLEGAEAIVVAVDRRARVTLAPAPTAFLHAPQLAGEAVAYERDGDGVRWHCDRGLRVRLGLAEELLLALPAGAAPIGAHVDTGAFFEGSAKIGLGSSAAMTAAWSRAAWPELTTGALFERALALHRRFQSGRGSGADVAASVHGGLVAYRRGADQPVRSLAVPAPLAWAAVWTGRSADTRDFLKRLGDWQDEEPGRYDRAMHQLVVATEAAVRAIEAGDVAGILAGVAECHRELAALGAQAGLPIVSPIHALLARLAESEELAYKPSGAGGGDFGLVFGTDPERLQRFAQRVVENGACIVPLAVDPAGVRLEADPRR